MEIEILNTAEINSQTTEQILTFDRFTKEEHAVYSLICPQRNVYKREEVLDKVEMPDRVRELVEMTKDRFARYEVWESEKYEIKDPIILGREETKRDDGKIYDWEDKVFFLARWGKELEDFGVLKQKAQQILKNEFMFAVVKIKAEAEAFLQNPDFFIQKAMDKNRTQPPAFQYAQGIFDI